MKRVTKEKEPERPAKKARVEVQQTLYIRNLNDKIARQRLRHTLHLLFSTYGEVLEINMKMKGQAHIVLGGPAAAAQALRELQGVSVYGKKLVLEYARTKSRCVEAAEKALAELHGIEAKT